MPAVAQQARSEEDVRHEVNKLLDSFVAEAGLQVRVRSEHAIAGGRLDSKYGGVIIEYKSPHGPGRIGTELASPGTRGVVKQLNERVHALQKEEKVSPDRVFGVGCDGVSFVFVRWRKGKPEAERPVPATEHTVERVLRALLSVGARGDSFTPDRLAEAFGADSEVARGAYADFTTLSPRPMMRRPRPSSGSGRSCSARSADMTWGQEPQGSEAGRALWGERRSAG